MPVPEDIYKSDVDFTSLALQYPNFASRLKTNGQLDFSDPESVRQLTYALLDRDFDLRISLPDDRLCPPVPNRFNYIIFIQKLIDSTQDHYAGTPDPEEKFIGLDIGTGASAIYPLLACRQRPSWLFLATEIDGKSKEFAIRSVKGNGLESRIKVLDTMDVNMLIPSPQLEQFHRIDVLLTNPPFYTSQAELQELSKKKARPPNSACTGAPVEMVCPGGEVGFVKKLIEESALPCNKTKIRWFSSMFGKLGSVSIVVGELKKRSCTNYAVTEFVQGQKTRRWCVAWSWSALRPSQAVARGTEAIEKKHLPFPTEFDFSTEFPADVVGQAIDQEITRLSGIEWRWTTESLTGVGKSMIGDVWSRKARRNLHKQSIDQDSMNLDISLLAGQSKPLGHQQDHEEDEESNHEKMFAFKIKVTPLNADGTMNITTITIRWLAGHDSTVFESFCGWLKRKMRI